MYFSLDQQIQSASEPLSAAFTGHFPAEFITFIELTAHAIFAEKYIFPWHFYIALQYRMRLTPVFKLFDYRTNGFSEIAIKAW